jgi:hypothetical protein
MHEGNGIWIPAEIWALDLNPMQRIMLARVQSLAQSSGTSWAGDEYLANELRCTVPYIRKLRKGLEELGYLTRTGYGYTRKLNVDLTPKEVPTGTSSNSHKFLQEQVPIVTKEVPVVSQEVPIVTKEVPVGAHIEEYSKENSKEVSKSIEAKPKKEATPKDLQTVIDAFVAAGQTSDLGERFYNYYESVGWVIGKARKPMKDWKATARDWIQRETKYQDESANNGWNKSGKRNGSYFHSSGKYKHPSDVLKDRDIWG